MALATESERSLAPLTTLGLGGAAARFVEADTREVLFEALALGEGLGLDVRVLGGGSNLVVADDGVPGLVVRMATRGIALERSASHAALTAEAGESWDALVERAVREGLFGVECLTGIPGTVGATPIQNVGAYGQEVSDVIEAVEVLDRQRRQTHWLAAADCGFGYRTSRFKREPARFVVLAVRFRLQTEGLPRVRYAELARALAGDPRPSLRTVQQTVRALRAQKGMLIEPGWEASAGSFFTNPIVSEDEAARVAQVASERGFGDVPRHDGGAGRVKLAAGWLIERSGIAKGMRRGVVGVSRHHALALVHHGGGSTRALLDLASEIQQQVYCTFGVQLEIEPVRWP